LNVPVEKDGKEESPPEETEKKPRALDRGCGSFLALILLVGTSGFLCIAAFWVFAA
jgi:hypothetical protein